MEKKGLFVRVHEWLAQPFQSGGSALNWVLFLGLIIIASWLWDSVLLLFLRKSREVV
jgi:hypothetical protein